MSNKAAAPLLALVAVLSWGAMFPIAAHAIPHVEPLHLTALRYGIASLAVRRACCGASRGCASAAPGGSRATALGARHARLRRLQPARLHRARAHRPAQRGADRADDAADHRAGALGCATASGPRRATIGATVVALAGVVLVISRGDLASLADGGVGLGSLLVLAGVFGWVLYTLGAADFPEFSPLRYTTLSAVAGTVSIVAITEIATAGGLGARAVGRRRRRVWPELAFIVVMGALVGGAGMELGRSATMGPQNALAVHQPRAGDGVRDLDRWRLPAGRGRARRRRRSRSRRSSAATCSPRR